MGFLGETKNGGGFVESTFRAVGLGHLRKEMRKGCHVMDEVHLMVAWDIHVESTVIIV